MRPKALNLQEDGCFLVRGHILYNYIILYSFTWFRGQLAMAQAIMDPKQCLHPRAAQARKALA